MWVQASPSPVLLVLKGLPTIRPLALGQTDISPPTSLGKGLESCAVFLHGTRGCGIRPQKNGGEPARHYSSLAKSGSLRGETEV